MAIVVMGVLVIFTVAQLLGSAELDGVDGKIDRNWLVGGPPALAEILIN